MNENTKNEVENDNSKGQQKNVSEESDQVKGQENKILSEDSLTNNDTVSDEDSSTNNDTVSDDDSSTNNETVSDEDNLETIDSLKKELSENKDKLLRSLAESENTRRQMEKIRMETNKYGVQPLARESYN